MPAWDVAFDLRVDDSDPQIVTLVAKAHALAAVIRSAPITPATQEKIDRLNILRAIRGTTGIEGSTLSEQEVQQVLGAPSKRPVLPASKRREEQEVRNAAAVMELVAQEVGRPKPPLSEALIRRIHRVTTQGIPYPQNTPGEYRTHAVTAGSYIPPRTGHQVRTLMAEFVKWFNSGAPREWDPIIRAIVAHFYVISIHPFGDGNGRTARGVESLLLYQAQINARGFYSLSNFYYRNRDQYVSLLDQVRFDGRKSLRPFLFFALRGLVSQLEEVHEEVLTEMRRIAFRDYVREELQLHDRLGKPSGDRMLTLLISLSNEPVSVRALRQGRHALATLYRRMTAKTLTRDLNFLKQHGLIVTEGDLLKANISLMDQFSAAQPKAR